MIEATISVVILTKNEEKNIEDCIKSVHNWADEIIIVDDESSDMTVELAKKYTPNIFTKKMDIEGRHRNWAYTKAKNEWVLSLDADERVTEELKVEITQILKTNPQENGFTIPRKNYIGRYWVRYGGWYPSPQLKLFRKDRFRYEEVEVHPRVFMDDPCGHLKNDIIHHSYKNIEDFLLKLNHQTTQEAQKWINTNRKMSFGHALWRTVDRFFRSFIRKKAYKDGFVGFIVSYFASLYQILSYAKYWEIKHTDAPHPSLSQRGEPACRLPDACLSPACRQTGQTGQSGQAGVRVGGN